jgi:hypothetical protein
MMNRTPKAAPTLEQLKTLPEIERLVQKKTLTPNETEWLVETLRRTHDAVIRNRAAIAMADLRVPGTERLLIDLISRPELKGYTGPLLYALGESGGKLPLSLAVSLLLNGAWETREQTLSLLEDHSVAGDFPKELREAMGKLQPLVQSPDEETAYVAQAAISALRSYAPNLDLSDRRSPPY